MVIVLLTRRYTSVTLNRKDNCHRTDPTRYLPNDPRNLICTTQYEYTSAFFCVNIHTLSSCNLLNCDAWKCSITSHCPLHHTAKS